MGTDSKHDFNGSVADFIRELAHMQQTGQLGGVGLTMVARDGSIARRFTMDEGFSVLLLAGTDVLHADLMRHVHAQSIPQQAETDTQPVEGVPHGPRPN